MQTQGFKLTNSTSFGESIFSIGLSRKLSRWTQMSELYTLIHNETDTRRIQKTLEDTTPWQGLSGYMVGPIDPTCRLASQWGPLSASSFECRFSTTLGFASTPFFQVGLIQVLRIDATPYIQQPLPPSWSHPKTLIHISHLDQHTLGGLGLELSNVVDQQIGERS